MPTINDIYDTETTFVLKTYELTLTCRKCSQGQLIGSGEPNEEGAVMHTCSHCQREQLVTEGPYPKTEVRKEKVDERYVINKEVIPDKDPDEYNQSDVSSLTQEKKVALLQTTRNPVIIDHLQKVTIHAVHHTLDDLLEALFDLAKQAATIRANGLPESELNPVLSLDEVHKMPLEEVIELVGKTNHRPENIDTFRKKNFGVLYSHDFRVALYDAAREVVAFRSQQGNSQDADPTSATPTKNKGGRSRKNPVAELA